MFSAVEIFLLFNFDYVNLITIGFPKHLSILCAIDKLRINKLPDK